MPAQGKSIILNVILIRLSFGLLAFTTNECVTLQVENYLMLSEFENNLIAEMPVILDRKGRRWSVAR
jgi:hypothetical protein